MIEVGRKVIFGHMSGDDHIFHCTKVTPVNTRGSAAAT